MKEQIFVFGASGHAKVVIDIIEKQGIYEIAFLVDDAPALKGKTVYGYRVLGGKSELLGMHGSEAPGTGIVAIGSNRTRGAVADWLEENNFRLATVVHPSSQLARGVSVGAGTVIMAGAVINSDSSVGKNAIVNTCASVDHDCSIGDGVHLAPGSTLCGTVTVAAGSFVCAGATIIPNLTIGEGATIGAGSTVIRDVPGGATAMGNPAKEVKQL